MNGFCSKGFAGCPGRVPLVASGQCRSHRIYARVKSKMEAAREQGPENIWIKAVNNVKNLTVANEFSRNVRNSHCRKEYCSSVWLPSQQVLLVSKYELVTPGLKGFKPEVLQAPQPLSRPGRWEPAVPGPCTKVYYYNPAPKLYAAWSTISSAQQDPNWTREKKTRQLLAKRKRKAHLRRQVKQEKKEASKFVNSSTSTVKAPSSAKKNDTLVQMVFTEEEKQLKNKTGMDEEDETKEEANKKEKLMNMGKQQYENGTFPALCQILLKSTNELLSEVPNITDSEESETDDDDDLEIDDNIKSTNEEFELDTPYDSENIDDNKVHNNSENGTFLALCQILLKSTNELLSEVPNLTDSEESESNDDDDLEIDDNIKSTNEEFELDTLYDSENIYDNKVHNNSEKLKHIEEEKECPVLSALRLKYKLKCQSNVEEIPRRRTGWSLGKLPIGLKGGANGNSEQDRTKTYQQQK